MAELPVIALLGRPNVGKSTLFNALSQSRQALVSDAPGMTRDLRLGRIDDAGRVCLLMDTGGVDEWAGGLGLEVSAHAREAVRSATVALCVLDASVGLTEADRELVVWARRAGVSLLPVVNKVDCSGADLNQFHELGLGELMLISARRGQGVQRLRSLLCEQHGMSGAVESAPTTPLLGIFGRPNVGKSTLMNALLGVSTALVSVQAGTTVDDLEAPFVWHGQYYRLLDTAGLRRRARIQGSIEYLAAARSLGLMSRAAIAIGVLDATEGVVEQDLRLLGRLLDSGCALVVAVNKSDLVGRAERFRLEHELQRRLAFLPGCDVCHLSALRQRGLNGLMRAVNRCRGSLGTALNSARLTRLLERAVAKSPPPLQRGRRAGLRFAHQSRDGAVIVVHGTGVDQLPMNYVRYLSHFFQRELGRVGTRIQIEFRSTINPFAGRRNRLTPRQHERRQRVIRYARHRKK